jgi:hypothetical protein
MTQLPGTPRRMTQQGGTDAPHASDRRRMTQLWRDRTPVVLMAAASIARALSRMFTRGRRLWIANFKPDHIPVDSTASVGVRGIHEPVPSRRDGSFGSLMAHRHCRAYRSLSRAQPYLLGLQIPCVRWGASVKHRARCPKTKSAFEILEHPGLTSGPSPPSAPPRSPYQLTCGLRTIPALSGYSAIDQLPGFVSTLRERYPPCAANFPEQASGLIADVDITLSLLDCVAMTTTRRRRALSTHARQFCPHR